MVGRSEAADHRTVSADRSRTCGFALAATVGLLFAAISGGCGGESGSSPPPAADTSVSTSVAGAVPGEAAPPALQGTWKLVSKSLDRGLLFVISDRHYRVPTRLAHGDLAVDGNEVAFYNAAICGLTLPDGVGRYRWRVEGETLTFRLIGEEPCGGRGDILEDSTYKRIG